MKLDHHKFYNKRVCSLHFITDDYVCRNADRRKLKPYAIPLYWNSSVDDHDDETNLDNNLDSPVVADLRNSNLPILNDSSSISNKPSKSKIIQNSNNECKHKLYFTKVRFREKVYKNKIRKLLEVVKTKNRKIKRLEFRLSKCKENMVFLNEANTVMD